MRKLLLILAAAVLLPALAKGQSSGSFSYGTYPTACVLQSNGTITPGADTCDETCSLNADGTITCTPAANGSGSTLGCIGSAKAGIKTNSGSGNVFDIRPSAVVALLTDVTVSSKQAANLNGVVSSSALAGIDFRVTVKGQSGQPDPSVTPSGYITYDARYVQISTNLFSALTSSCTGTAAATLGCFITFNESTLSAHSFDWIAGGPTNGGTPLSSGQYVVKVDWKPSSGFGVTGIGQALACVGPVNLTVQQNKVFSFNTVNPI
jgi:hypothetical protein